MRMKSRYDELSDFAAWHIQQALKVTRQLLENEESWIQGENARDANGDRVRPNDLAAVKWSLSGAIMAAYSRVNPELGWDLVEDTEDEIMFFVAGPMSENIYEFNDRAGHGNILDALDHAIIVYRHVDKPKEMDED